MAVLVTGGAGYIGSIAVLELLKNKEEVIIVDNLSRGHREAVSGGTLYIGDLRDKAFLSRVFSETKIDSVLHFAADSQVGESVLNPLKYYSNNLGSALSLIETMAAFGVKKLVFSSSAAVYGEPGRIPIREGDAARPANPYGETKIMVEQILKRCGKAYGIGYASLRYFNAAGADKSGMFGEDHTPETHLVPLVLKSAADPLRELFVFGDDYDTPDKTCVRDYIHVTDLANAHLLALAYLEAGGKSEVFNLGNGKGYSVLEVIKTAEKVTGQKINYKIAGRREGDPAVLVASAEKAKSVLGWEIKHPDLSDIIADAWRFFKNHPNGYGEK